MKWREIGPYLRELWHRPAGPMNWKNPIRVFAVLGWLFVQGFVLLGLAGWRVFQALMLLGWTHYCPIISRIVSVGWRNGVVEVGNQGPPTPVKWAFSRKR